MSEKNKGGGEKLRGGETYHKAPPQKRFWTPPLMIPFPPPFVHAMSFSLQEMGRDQTNPTFGGLQNWVWRGHVMIRFPSPKSQDTFCPPFVNSQHCGLGWRREPLRQRIAGAILKTSLPLENFNRLRYELPMIRALVCGSLEDLILTGRLRSRSKIAIPDGNLEHFQSLLISLRWPRAVAYFTAQFVRGSVFLPFGPDKVMFVPKRAPDAFNFLRHVMRAILSVRPKCSHRCVSLRKSSSTQPKTQPSKPL